MTPDPKLAAALGIPLHEPKKFDTETPWEGDVTRAFVQDIQTAAPWLVPKLAAHWPHRQPLTIINFLISVSQDNAHCLCKTPNGMALGTLATDAHDPRPYVEVIFANVRAYPENKPELLRLYGHLITWAKARRIPTLKFGTESTDFPKHEIKAMLKPDTTQNVYTVGIKL